MVLDTEAHYKYKTLALNILSKALDDICPKFESEPPTIRKDLIKERVSFFNEQEKLIDKEWSRLEKEAKTEVTNLKKERLQVIKKLEKTRKTSRIKLKVQHLERNKNKRVKYLKGKLKVEEQKLQKQLATLKQGSKKFAQISNKLSKTQKDITLKISSVTTRYDKIIATTLASDNTAYVDERIKHSYSVWKRKLDKLNQQFIEKEIVHEHKRLENDTIRVAVEDFVSNLDGKGGFRHWCLSAGIPVKVCYKEVQVRLKLLGRKSIEIDNLVASL